jgi:hypothetical protein
LSIRLILFITPIHKAYALWIGVVCIHSTSLLPLQCISTPLSIFHYLLHSKGTLTGKNIHIPLYPLPYRTIHSTAIQTNLLSKAISTRINKQTIVGNSCTHVHSTAPPYLYPSCHCTTTYHLPLTTIHNCGDWTGLC